MEIVETIKSSYLHSKDITEIHPSFRFARWARTVHNFIIWEDKLTSKRDGSVVNKGCTKSGQNDRIETNDRFDNFESKTQPENAQDGADGKVQ
jgi:hypothetical protein